MVFYKISRESRFLQDYRMTKRRNINSESILLSLPHEVKLLLIIFGDRNGKWGEFVNLVSAYQLPRALLCCTNKEPRAELAVNGTTD